VPVRVVNLGTFARARVRPCISRRTVKWCGAKEELDGVLRFERLDWSQVEDSRSSLAYTKPQHPFWTHTGWGRTLWVGVINEGLNV